MMARLQTILKNTIAVVAIATLSLGGGFLGARLAGDGPAGAAQDGGSASVPAMETVQPTPAAFSQGDVPTAADADVAQAFQARFRQVAAATLPVVVEINTVNTIRQEVPTNPFSFFFGRPDGGTREREYRQRGLGSGVLVARDGDTVFVLTNNHVAGEADEIEIVLSDGRTYAGEIEGTDELLDLALLSFSTDEDVPIARLGDSEQLAIGDWVFAVGNPLGFQSSVTAGIVSANERNVPAESGLSGVTSYIQTDASINQGNSGGALVNLNGEVVGINTWIASRSGGSDGIGFAIPINMAQRAINDFIERGEVAYSWLGVMAGNAPEILREDLEIDTEDGAFIFGVYDESPAQQGDLRPGDMVVAVNGRPISSSSDLVRTIAALSPDAQASLTVIRAGEEVDVTIRTSVREQDPEGRTHELWPGLAVQPLTDELRGQLDLPRRLDGVVVASVSENTPAAGSGLRRGDVITEVSGRSVDSAAAFYDALASVDAREVQFRVRRGDNTVILGFVRPTA